MSEFTSGERMVRDVVRFARSSYGQLSKPTRIAGLLFFALVVGGFAVFLTLHRFGPETKARSQTISGVRLTAAQRKSVGVLVTALQPEPLPQILRAPGEVRTNDYVTAVVAPRITATVVARHAKLGDIVVKGQILVTLYSRDMAEAQSGFVLSERDLARYRKLNATAAIAAQQYDQAIGKRQELFGRLLSFGLTPSQIAGLTSKGLTNSATGQFDLVAPESGTITRDDFREGDVADPSNKILTLFEITDPKNVWVEAHVSPTLARNIAGQTALVIAGDQRRTARIIQINNIVDESTRTITVRLAVDNGDTALKPGQFVDVELYGSAEPVLAVPTAAVLRSPDGDWIVYVESKDGSFRARQVQVRYAVGDRTAIAGLPVGTRVVTAGTFFVHSESQRSDFESDD